MNVGPMLNGYSKEKLAGSGTIVWSARKQLASKEIDYSQFLDVTTSSAPSVGQ
jgi:dihydroxy-acid dehydratase